MKRGTPDHPKTIMLEQELRQVYARHRKLSQFGGRAEAVGLLELLWHWTRQYAIRGDIGKWPDDVIASGIGWRFSGKELISSLIFSHWLDEAPAPFRLVIHDLQDHADNAWRQNLEDAGLTWWDGRPPRKYKLQKTKEKLQKDSRNSPQPEPEPSGSPENLPFPEPEPSPPPPYPPTQNQNPTSSHQSRFPDSPEPSPDVLAIANGKESGSESTFETFWALFVVAGVSLNDRDKERALRLWLNYEKPEHEQIIQWVIGEMKTTWTDAKHTPRPASALESKGWTRTAAARIITGPTTGRDKGDEVIHRMVQRAQERAALKKGPQNA